MSQNLQGLVFTHEPGFTGIICRCGFAVQPCGGEIHQHVMKLRLQNFIDMDQFADCRGYARFFLQFAQGGGAEGLAWPNPAAGY